MSSKVTFNIETKNSKWKIVRENLFYINNTIKFQDVKMRKVSTTTETTTLDQPIDDEISISEFSIFPNIKKSKILKSSKNHDYALEYFKETKNARETRRRLSLPSVIYKRNKFNFSDIVNRLGQIHEIESELTKPKYEPTYQLGPKIRFNSLIAQTVIQQLLSNFLSIINVSQLMSSQSSVKSSMDHLCTQIKTRIKSFADKRYKLIVICNVVQQKNQGIIAASKCLWDNENDVCTTVIETHKNYVILINLFAVYHE